jgi:hypothetical protein
MSQVILPKDFAVGQLSYGTPKQLDSGGKSIYVNYSGQPLIIQTPEMSLPFGISVWNNDRTGLPDKYSLDVSFQGLDSRDGLQALHTMLKTMDERIVTDANENSQAWFKKRFPSRDVVVALYTPMVKVAKDRETGEPTDKFPPTFKMSLPFKDGAFKLDGVYDERRRTVNLMDIVGRDGTGSRGKGSRVRVITQCSGVWVAGGKFGCTWKVKQLIIVPPATLKAFAFVADDSGNLLEDDDEDEEEEAVSPVKKPAAAKKPAAHLIASSDEDEDAPAAGSRAVDDDDEADPLDSK